MSGLGAFPSALTAELNVTTVYSFSFGARFQIFFLIWDLGPVLGSANTAQGGTFWTPERGDCARLLRAGPGAGGPWLSPPKVSW